MTSQYSEVNSLIWAIEADNHELVAKRVKEKPFLADAMNEDGVTPFARSVELGRRICMDILSKSSCSHDENMQHLIGRAKIGADQIEKKKSLPPIDHWTPSYSPSENQFTESEGAAISALAASAASRIRQAASESRDRLMFAEKNSARQARREEAAALSVKRRARG